MVSELARQLLEKKALFLDTETTGLGTTDEIVEIAVLDSDGTPLLDTLINPTVCIPIAATTIHGISESDLSDAPSFADILPRLLDITHNRIIVTYNAEYDIRMLEQSAKAHNMKVEFNEGVYCAMHMCAEFFGEVNYSGGGYRWHKLEVAAKRCNIKLPPAIHRARTDAELTRQIVEYIARADLNRI